MCIRDSDIVFSAKPREVATKLGPAITANRGGPTEGIKQRRKYIDDRFGGKGAEHVEEGVSAPMVHTDEERLAAKGEKIKANVLHRMAEMSRGRSSRHRVAGL